MIDNSHVVATNGYKTELEAEQVRDTIGRDKVGVIAVFDGMPCWENRDKSLAYIVVPMSVIKAYREIH